MTAELDMGPVPLPATGASIDIEALVAPALVVSIAGAAAGLVAANAAGRRWLGIGEDVALPVAWDVAMPALARLRQSSMAVERGEAGAGAGPEPLVFWMAGRVIAVRARVTPAGGDRVLVTFEDGAGQFGAETVRPATRVDADRLASIAARLRQGMARRQDAGGTSGRMAGPGEPRPDAAAAGPDELAVAIARLAHELRTPLSAIVAMSEVIRDERLGPDARDRYREYAGNIHDSARHALAVAGAMLDPETAVDGQEPAPTFVEVDVASLVKECLDTIAPLAASAGLTVAGALSDRVPHLVADARGLRQIVLNLATNALKFTPRGGTVTVASQILADGRFEMSVTDSGIGMSEAELGHVVDAMARGSIDAGAPRPGGGRGLGLPMVRRLAAQSGGRVDIASMPGRGTCVRLTFDASRVVPV